MAQSRAPQEPGIRIAIIDPQDLNREGIANAISVYPELVLVGSAQDAITAMDPIAKAMPDVVLLNLGPSLQTFKNVCDLVLEQGEAKVIALAIDPSHEELDAVMNSGAKGYVLKKSCDETIIEAFRAVADGQSYIDPVIAQDYKNR